MYEDFVKEFGGDGPEAPRGGAGRGRDRGPLPPAAFVRGGTVRPGQPPPEAPPPGAGGAAAPPGRKPGGRYVPSFMPPGMAAAMDKADGKGGEPGKGEGDSGEGAAPKPDEPVFHLPGSTGKGKPRAIDALLANLKRWVAAEGLRRAGGARDRPLACIGGSQEVCILATQGTFLPKSPGSWRSCTPPAEAQAPAGLLPACPCACLPRLRAPPALLPPAPLPRPAGSRRSARRARRRACRRRARSAPPAPSSTRAPSTRGTPTPPTCLWATWRPMWTSRCVCVCVCVGGGGGGSTLCAHASACSGLPIIV